MRCSGYRKNCPNYEPYWNNPDRDDCCVYLDDWDNPDWDNCCNPPLDELMKEYEEKLK
jgi:hypothetical protein